MGDTVTFSIGSNKKGDVARHITRVHNEMSVGGGGERGGGGGSGSRGGGSASFSSREPDFSRNSGPRKMARTSEEGYVISREHACTLALSPFAEHACTRALSPIALCRVFSQAPIWLHLCVLIPLPLNRFAQRVRGESSVSAQHIPRVNGKSEDGGVGGAKRRQIVDRAGSSGNGLNTGVGHIEGAQSGVRALSTLCCEHIEAALDVGREVMLAIFLIIFRTTEGSTWTDCDGPRTIKNTMRHTHPPPHFPYHQPCKQWDCTLLKNLIATNTSRYCMQDGPAIMAGHSIAEVKAIVVSHTNPEQKLAFSHKQLNDWLQITEGNVKVLLGQIETEDATKFRAKLDSIGPKNVTLSTAGMFAHTQ